MQSQPDARASFQSVKTINDPVHGTIQLHTFAQVIMDRPQFQRLRRLKQLALTDLVYPSATKTRFEHSIGTYHLAWEMAKKLRGCLSEEQFSEEEAVCVAIAGLCHDLGHGPYSHLWESLLNSQGIKYHHERMSVQVLNSIVDDVARRQDSDSQEFSHFMQTRWPGGCTHQKLIGDLILGAPDGECSKIPPEKQFLYEIVNNKRTGFDVDKIDYLNRDAQSLGLTTRFDASRQLSLLRVLPCRDPASPAATRMLLVLRDKQVLDYINLLVARRQMHYIAYQHVKSIAFEKVFQDALSAARDHLKSHRSEPGTDPRAVQYLLDSPESLESLLWLTDDRLMELLKLSCGSEAARLMKQLEERGKYPHLASVRMALRSEADAESYAEQLRKAEGAVSDWNSSRRGSIAELRKFDYGCGPRHPLNEVFCYSKSGEVRQCWGSGPPGSLLFTDLQLAALHITVVRLYERKAEEPLADWRKQEEQEFRAAFKEFGFEPTAE